MSYYLDSNREFGFIRKQKFKGQTVIRDFR